MIDLISEEQVALLIEERRQTYKTDKAEFYVLTPQNHLFFFYEDKDIALHTPKITAGPIRDLEVVSRYGLAYTNESPYIIFSEEIKAFYETSIQNPQCMFFLYYVEKDLLMQELRHRGLI